jgi:hypothetical protein
MLDTIACEGLDTTTVETYGKVDREFALGLSQHLSHILGKV